MRNRFCLALGAGGLVVAGCQTFRSPDTYTESWTPPREATNRVDNTWAELRGASVEEEQPLALADLMRMAIENNAGLREAWYAARQAQAVQDQARRPFYPQANVSGQLAREKGNSASNPDDVTSTTYGPKWTVTWLLLDFGGRSATLDQGALSLLAQNFLFNKAFQDLLLSVQTGYYGYMSAQASVTSAEAALETAQKSLDTARQRFEAGLSTRLDVLQAQSDFDDAQYTLEEARGAVQTQWANLLLALGLPPARQLRLQAPTGPVPTDVPEAEIGALIDEAIGRRPDVGAQRAAVLAADAAARAANSDLWPTLDAGLTGQRTWRRYTDSDLENSDDHQYMAYLGVSWDVFDGFYNLNRKREAEAKLALEREKLRDTELSASADVWNRFYDLRTAIQKNAFSGAFLESTQASYDLALEGYNTGLKSILDLLQAQSKLADARSRRIDAEKGVYLAVANFAHAMGSLSTPADR